LQVVAGVNHTAKVGVALGIGFDVGDEAVHGGSFMARWPWCRNASRDGAFPAVTSAKGAAGNVTKFAELRLG
jgi:hypothetical protein